MKVYQRVIEDPDTSRWCSWTWGFHCYSHRWSSLERMSRSCSKTSKLAMFDRTEKPPRKKSEASLTGANYVWPERKASKTNPQCSWLPPGGPGVPNDLSIHLFQEMDKDSSDTIDFPDALGPDVSELDGLQTWISFAWGFHRFFFERDGLKHVETTRQVFLKHWKAGDINVVVWSHSSNPEVLQIRCHILLLFHHERPISQSGWNRILT